MQRVLITLEPHRFCQFLDIVLIVDCTNLLDVQVLLPLLRLNLTPKSLHHHFAALLCLERKHFGHGFEEGDEFRASVDDESFKQLLVHDAEGEAEVSEENAEILSFLFAVEANM